jgi:hypothetical protein
MTNDGNVTIDFKVVERKTQLNTCVTISTTFQLSHYRIKYSKATPVKGLIGTFFDVKELYYENSVSDDNLVRYIKL